MAANLFGLPREALPRAQDVYRVDRRELSFLLWEQSGLEREYLGRAPFAQTTRAGVEALLDRAQDFATRLAAAYRDSDRQPARLGADGQVQVPAAYPALWAEFRRDWSWIRRMGEQPAANSGVAGAGVPPLVVQLISEMFMGANPAFMTYGGFTAFAMRLIEQHGTPAQRALFLPRLGSDEWDACYCATESLAGSDLTAITTEAELLEGEVYRITGHKRYITAGMHPLTPNTVGVVIARIKEPAQRAFSLSCFLVPWRWSEGDGTGDCGLSGNHVQTAHVEDKMGLNGCANTHLVFGRSGPTRGYLLGNRRDVALPQLVTLMRNARISTGQFGLAMASSAYLHSLHHARTRVQGRRFVDTADSSAPKVAIVEHADVQRMLLDMRAKVEGCRGLIARLVGHLTRIEQLKAEAAPPMAELDRHRKLVLLYTPIVKAYVSDEAWRVATTAIQVHGGRGYLRDGPVEQYARDIKVLSIWEGTNYMQAQDLLRDKLNYGRGSTLMRLFEEELRGFLGQRERWPVLAAEFAVLEAAFEALREALAYMGELAQRGLYAVLSQCCTRVLEVFAEVLLGWSLIEAGTAALVPPEGQRHDTEFYAGKLKTVRHYVHNVLNAARSKARALLAAEHTCTEISDAEFGYRPLPGRQASVAALAEPAHEICNAAA